MLSPLDAVPTLTKTGRIRRTRKGSTVKPAVKKVDVELDCPPDMLGHMIGGGLERSGLPGIHNRLLKDESCWNNIKKVQEKYKDKVFGSWMLELVTGAQIITHSANAYREKKSGTKPDTKELPPSEKPVVQTSREIIHPDKVPIKFTANPKK